MEEVKTDPKSLKEERERDITTTFWYNVEKRLKETGHTNAWLGRATGLLPQSIVSAKYHGSSVNIYTALRICKALDCTIEDMLYSGAPVSTKSSESINKDLVENAEKERDTSRFTDSALLFKQLSKIQQEAVLVHLFSCLNVGPEETLKRIRTRLSNEVNK